ncbi:MAG: hypothetical protein QOI11_3754 [Candidatus Eremiobacteraeota bacterium]|jgi:hypothetical protein|nr:hypothetical protein [Candidatus Eremiobacteraeota bacterium]
MECSPFARSRLAELRASYAPQSFDKHDLLADRYLLAREGRYRVYYVPTGAWPRPDAKVILLGLTPGLAQAMEAAHLFAETPAMLRDDEATYSSLLRKHVAFKGSMRTNLCTMLDQLGLPKALGLSRSDDLFHDPASPVATTSALIFPVFTGTDLRNFSGGGGALGKLPLFRQMLEELLVPRLVAAPSALIVPFGKSSASGLHFLVERGLVAPERVLSGFPHPSGANGHRKRQFEARREELAHALRTWFAKTPV